MTDHRFQIDLGGIIDLLANHLYSTPQVYVRELLQNAIDAITARRALEPDHAGSITIEHVAGRDGGPATLLFADDGVGLTDDEVHQFLATIGRSSKRADLDALRSEFIGQFGIGLLSCFMVSDEIVMITRSARDPDAKALRFEGRADGTYTVTPTDLESGPGTQVWVRAKPAAAEWVEADALERLLLRFGGLLPVPIRFSSGGAEPRVLNAEGAPWRRRYASAEEEREAILAFGAEMFEVDMLDFIPLRSRPGEVDGVAFVLPPSHATVTGASNHRVYLRNMLLSERVDNLLPSWAFFVKCVVNCNGLRPTAGRESFYEDADLEATRAALGKALRSWLVRTAEHDPARLDALIRVHHRSMKALAVEDEDFYRVIADWLPFETTGGRIPLGELRSILRAGVPPGARPLLRFTKTVDEFRQVAPIATSQRLTLVNAGWDYDEELLERLPVIDPGIDVEPVAAVDLVADFEELDPAEADRAARLLAVAERTLAPHRCSAEVRRFLPAELPALYGIGDAALFRRSVDIAKEGADETWSALMDGVAGGPGADPGAATLCLNLGNPLVGKLTRVADEELLRRAVELLYVQSLMLGHHPLRETEMTLLNEGLLALIELGIDARGGEEGRP